MPHPLSSQISVLLVALSFILPLSQSYFRPLLTKLQSSCDFSFLFPRHTLLSFLLMSFSTQVSTILRLQEDSQSSDSTSFSLSFFFLVSSFSSFNLNCHHLSYSLPCLHSYPCTLIRSTYIGKITAISKFNDLFIHLTVLLQQKATVNQGHLDFKWTHSDFWK